jgi:glutamine cyclotransferase
VQSHLKIAIAVVVAVAVGATVYYLVVRSGPRVPAGGSIPVYTYRVVRSFNHDPEAFTQGLVYDGGSFYEGTGLRGRSSLRQVDAETGRVIRLHKLSDEYFGEGVTLRGSQIIQLTYTSNVGFIYDKRTFEPLDRFNYPTEGWGITSDGTQLIMSDGTSTLYLLDPATFERTGQITVTAAGKPVTGLNELEYVKGEIYANVWPSDRVAMISPNTGEVTGWIRLSGLAAPQDQSDPARVPNGIAYDAGGDRLFVTGKLWPRLYEIQLLKMGTGNR